MNRKWTTDGWPKSETGPRSWQVSSRAGLDERAAVVTSLESRLTERFAACWASASDGIQHINETGSRLEAGMAGFGGQMSGLAGQMSGLVAGFAHMGSHEESRETAMLQIRDQLSARQDEIKTMVSRLSETVDYQGMTRRVRADMRRLLPPAARVIVVSKGDPDLLDVEGRDVWHFPQDDRGHYAGHYPAESGEAIAHLETLRARGAHFFVIPSTAFWWLEHYGDLARHLDTHYQQIWKSADCQIYELAGTDQSRQPELGPRETTEARPMLQTLLAEQEEPLFLEQYRQHSPIGDIHFHRGQYTELQDRMARANEQLAVELRSELHRALEANRASWETALARHDDRASLADRQGLDRHRQLIQAMAQMEQPIADLQRDLDRASTGLDESLAPALLEPGACRSITAAAPPAPEPGSILAVCDMPGPYPVTVGPGHLRVRGWALSKVGVAEVVVLVDGLPREGVVYGAVRLDVEAAHPDFPDADRSGFVGKIDLEGLTEGEHSLVVRVRGRDGGELELNRSFRLDPFARLDRRLLNAEYRDWLAERMPSESDLARMRIAAMDLPYQPLISLVVPVHNTPEDYLRPMANSVMAQTYGRWELCLANGGSTAPHVRPFLDRLAKQDPRVKVVHLPQNLGIAGHSNAALALATGEFIGLLDSDDLLMPHALFEVARALNDAPQTDLVYSDEDKIDETGSDRWDAFFKPDWSPDLLFSMNYICHFGVYRRSLVEAIGRFRPEYDGSQDYDLVLRVTEQTDRIVHIPSILYSWRVIPGSTAGDDMAKPYAADAARRAIDDALRRRGVAGHVEPGCVPGRWRVRYDLRGQPAVTLVIAAGGNMKCLRACLGSVLERSTYPNLCVLVTDDSDGTEVADHCRALARRDPRLRYRRFRLKPFNYAAVNNSAVAQVDTPYLVLLNDDITVITPDWVEAMLEHAQRPEVGVVGAQLLYPDRSLQHAGVIMGTCENCGHAFKYFSEDDPGYFALARSLRNCSAVTFACAMMRRSVFDEVGGLDTRNLAVAFNDVDMCLRIRERGYWVVYTPHAVLFHHESATRTMHSNPGEEDYMRRRWAAVIRHDPFYNPNLTRDAEDYSLNFNAPTIAKRLGLAPGSNGRLGDDR